MVDDSVTAAERSVEGFAEFFEASFGWLSRLAFMLTGSSAVADEIAQDACEQVLRRWPEVTNPGAYARLAVMNGARGWGRRRQRQQRRAVHVVASQVMVDADAIAVRQALAELPERLREVVVLRYYADMRVDEIADALGLPSGTVKSHIHRGLARLEEALS